MSLPYRIIVLLWLVTMTAACQSGSATPTATTLPMTTTTPTTAMESTPTPESATIPAPTTTPPPTIAMESPTTAPTLTAEGTAESSPDSTPVAETGDLTLPYLLFSSAYSMEPPNMSLAVAPLDGSALLPLENLPDGRGAISYFTSGGDYAAALAYTETVATNAIWVWDVQTQAAVAQIPLFSAEAQALIETRITDPTFADYDEFFYEVGLPVWSPSGDIVTFAAAPEGILTRIYAYNPATDETTLLIDSENNSRTLGWSPEGTWLLYHETPTFSPNTSETGGMVRAFNRTTNTTVDLFEVVEPYQAIITWLDDSRLVISTAYFEGPSEDLRVVDLGAGTSELLLEGQYGSIAIDTENGIALLNESFSMTGGDPELTDQFIRLDLATGESQPITISSFYGFTQWVEPLGLFYTLSNDENILFLDNMGTPVNEGSAELFSSGFQASPAGDYVLSYVNELWTIVSIEGEVVASLGTGGNATWLPDGSGVLFTEGAEGAQALVRFRADNGWQREELIPSIAPYQTFEIVTE